MEDKKEKREFNFHEDSLALPEVIESLRKKYPDITGDVIRDIIGEIEEFSITKVDCFSAPYPHPEIMEGYARIDSDFPDRLIRSVEQEGEHRRKCENRMVFTRTRNETIGLFMAFFIVVSTIASGVWLTSIGKDGYGVGVAVTPILGAVGVFIYGKLKTPNNH